MTSCPWLILRCPRCNRVEAMEQIPFDPPTATYAEVRCPGRGCDDGDFDSLVYWDGEGRDVSDDIRYEP